MCLGRNMADLCTSASPLLPDPHDANDPAPIQQLPERAKRLCHARTTSQALLRQCSIVTCLPTPPGPARPTVRASGCLPPPSTVLLSTPPDEGRAVIGQRAAVPSWAGGLPAQGGSRDLPRDETRLRSSRKDRAPARTPTEDPAGPSIGVVRASISRSQARRSTETHAGSTEPKSWRPGS